MQDFWDTRYQEESPYHQGTAHIVQFVGIKALEAIQK